YLAVQHPAKIRRIVLQAPAVDGNRRTWPEQVFHWLRVGSRERVSVNAVLLRDCMDAGLRRVARSFAEALATPLEDLLPRVSQPTLVVRGNADTIVSSEWAERVASLLPNGRLVTVEGA